MPIEQYRRIWTDRGAAEADGAKLSGHHHTVPVRRRRRRAEDVIRYNEVAAAVMREHSVAIDDLYAFALPQLSKIQLPENVHFSPQGSEVLARQVAESIRQALATRKMGGGG